MPGLPINPIVPGHLSDCSLCSNAFLKAAADLLERVEPTPTELMEEADDKGDAARSAVDEAIALLEERDELLTDAGLGLRDQLYRSNAQALDALRLAALWLGA